MKRHAERHTNRNGESHVHTWWIKIGRDTSRVRDCCPRPDYPAQGSPRLDYPAQVPVPGISPHNFWL